VSGSHHIAGPTVEGFFVMVGFGGALVTGDVGS
jgi:hypothetical protein